MGTLHDLRRSVRHGEGPPFDPPGGGGDDGGMEERMRAVEDRLLKLEVKSDNFATKEDVRMLEAAIRASESLIRGSMNDQTWKFVTWSTTIALALLAGAFFIAKHVP